MAEETDEQIALRHKKEAEESIRGFFQFHSVKVSLMENWLTEENVQMFNIRKVSENTDTDSENRDDLSSIFTEITIDSMHELSPLDKTLAILDEMEMQEHIDRIEKNTDNENLKKFKLVIGYFYKFKNKLITKDSFIRNIDKILDQ